MLVRVSASFVAGQSADLAPCTPSGLNGDLCERGNKTEEKRKGRRPGMQAYPAYKCQYTALLQSPEDTKMGRSRQVAGMSTSLLVVSPRARAAPTRTPMLRETDSRHRSTRRGQCYATAVHVFTLRPGGAWYSDNRIIALAWLTWRCF
ncbi:hypothetical protein V8C34DRAFT_267843 [Trichoderma compactum]